MVDPADVDWPTGEWLRLIFEVVPQPLWVIDGAGAILFANPAAAAALGYADAAQLVGMPSHGTVHYKHPDGTAYPEAECPMLGPIVTGRTMHSDDEWLVRRDGSMFPISWSSGPIEIPSGRGAVWAFSDISERLAAEKAVRERDAAEVRAAESRAAQRRILESSNAARQRVVRDLHDGAQQRLVTMLLALQLAKADSADEKTSAVFDSVIDDARTAISELRELAAGIHPSILANRGLEAAIRALAARSAVPLEVKGSAPEDLPDDVATSAYFLIAEALTNVVKHAKASRVVVSLEQVDGSLVVNIQDDGVGGATPGAGSGLTGMSDRAGALGGSLTVESPAGGGTRVQARLPL